MVESFLEPLFWDVDITILDLKNDQRFIIERILEEGNDKAVTWLLGNYSKDQIADVVQKSHRISQKSRNYWGIKLGLWSTWNQFPAQHKTIWKY